MCTYAEELYNDTIQCKTVNIFPHDDKINGRSIVKQPILIGAQYSDQFQDRLLYSSFNHLGKHCTVQKCLVELIVLALLPLPQINARHAHTHTIHVERRMVCVGISTNGSHANDRELKRFIFTAFHCQLAHKLHVSRFIRFSDMFIASTTSDRYQNAA